MRDGTHTKKRAAKRLGISSVTSQLIISAPSIQEVTARLELSHPRKWTSLGWSRVGGKKLRNREDLRQRLCRDKGKQKAI